MLCATPISGVGQGCEHGSRRGGWVSGSKGWRIRDINRGGETHRERDRGDREPRSQLKQETTAWTPPTSSGNPSTQHTRSPWIEGLLTAAKRARERRAAVNAAANATNVPRRSRMGATVSAASTTASEEGPRQVRAEALATTEGESTAKARLPHPGRASCWRQVPNRVLPRSYLAARALPCGSTLPLS